MRVGIVDYVCLHVCLRVVYKTFEALDNNQVAPLIVSNDFWPISSETASPPKSLVLLAALPVVVDHSRSLDSIRYSYI